MSFVQRYTAALPLIDHAAYAYSQVAETVPVGVESDALMGDELGFESVNVHGITPQLT
jgi:hypothetical protein